MISLKTGKLQQGDVILKKQESAVNTKDGKVLDHLILAEGEATGHRHEIVSGVAQLIIMENTTILKVLSDYAKLKHNTHQEIEIPKGDYTVNIVKEYDEVKERRVAD